VIALRRLAETCGLTFKTDQPKSQFLAAVRLWLNSAHAPYFAWAGMVN
jgi:hypothetical protein